MRQDIQAITRHYDELPDGTEIASEGQIFRLEGVIQRPQGKLTYLWVANCARCGQEFSAMTPYHFAAIHRVCAECEPPVAPRGASGPRRRRGRTEQLVLELVGRVGLVRDTLGLDELVALADALPTPEPGRRDLRRQVVTRAIRSLGREKGGPLDVSGNTIILHTGV